jgi:glutamyl-tRNA synthetase
MRSAAYRGRLAPTPSGRLHLGHARTFYWAHRRARERNGLLFLRLENLDYARCKTQYAEEIIEDLALIGLSWDGKIYYQHQRLKLYRSALCRLYQQEKIYPSPHSRQDLAVAPSSPHGEPLFPAAWRTPRPILTGTTFPEDWYRQNWRFRVPDKQDITFNDRYQGSVTFRTGVDFGDFLVWRKDGIPSYELAVVVDDAAQRITEVVRGADLLLSTARQLLLYDAFQWPIPDFLHLPLLLDQKGEKLSKSQNSPAWRNYPPESRQNWLKQWSSFTLP